MTRKFPWKIARGLAGVLLAALLFSASCVQEPPVSEDALYVQAGANGLLANEGFRRSRDYVSAWLRQTDPQTGLIPKNLDWQIYPEKYKKGGRDIWNAKDAAADNYPFMVLTASIVDRPLFEGRMLDMLRAETKLTSRVDRLPDTYVFSKKGFLTQEPNLKSILFGSSEYVKDGLLSLTEWLGPSPWSERMTGILDDMWKHAPIDTPHGKIVSTNAEENGEMLQTLSRVYWMTGDKKYLEWAVRLGDYYLLENHHPTQDASFLKLRDHGCEIISGLCELYATASFALPRKKAAYQKPLHKLLDRILKVGRNKHGLFYDSVNPRSGKHPEGLADTWGYTCNGFYTVYLIDRTKAYRRAVLKALSSLNDHYRNHSWEGDSADGYADAIEGALYLYNREAVPTVADWMDSEIKVLWSKQRKDGLIEGWHCDGNFARTTLLYCLWKTRGVTIRPWREDVVFGAVHQGSEIWLSLKAREAWRGRIVFDAPRHKTIMKLPLDWPRINQWPEWFVVEAAKDYVLTDASTQTARPLSGRQLQDGLEVTLKAGEEQRLRLMLAN